MLDREKPQDVVSGLHAILVDHFSEEASTLRGGVFVKPDLDFLSPRGERVMRIMCSDYPTKEVDFSQVKFEVRYNKYPNHKLMITPAYASVEENIYSEGSFYHQNPNLVPDQQTWKNLERRYKRLLLREEDVYNVALNVRDLLLGPDLKRECGVLPTNYAERARTKVIKGIMFYPEMFLGTENDVRTLSRRVCSEEFRREYPNHLVYAVGSEIFHISPDLKANSEGSSEVAASYQAAVRAQKLVFGQFLAIHT